PTVLDYVDALPGRTNNAWAADITADGLLVVGSSVSSQGREPIMWTAAGGTQSLGNLPTDPAPHDGRAAATSSDGGRIVGTSGARLFVYEPSVGMRDLQEILEWLGVTEIAGWTLAQVHGISDDGSVIVGSGWNPSGDLEAWAVRVGDDFAQAGTCQTAADCDDGDPCTAEACNAGLCASNISPGVACGNDGICSPWGNCLVCGPSETDCITPGMIETTPLDERVFENLDSGGSLSCLGVVAASHPIAANGQVIVGFEVDYDGGTDDRAHRWSPTGGYEVLWDLSFGRPDGRASAVSADGTIVMGHSWSGTSASDPTYWAGPLGGEPAATSFGSWPPGYSSGQAHVLATSADGAVAGGYFSNAGTYAFLWSATSGWELLDPLPGHAVGSVRDVSADGSVAVGCSSETVSSGSRPVMWTQAGGVVELGQLSTASWAISAATHVSDDGAVAIGSAHHFHNCDGGCGSTTTVNAFRWTQAAGMVGLPQVFPNVASDKIAHAVSPDGQVVAGWSAVASGQFTWSAQHGTEDLRDALARTGIDAAGWSLQVLDILELGGTTYLIGAGRFQTGPPVMWRAAYE
ncbi:MAG: hypothetical protein OXU20_08920, partial [Myxococcales bacterium]|nr:hypothetical protein [Myxococcales bacterium]